MVHPAAKKRGADPHVPDKAHHEKPRDEAERKLEQGLEETMAGSDPVSVTQPRPGRKHTEPGRKHTEPESPEGE